MSLLSNLTTSTEIAGEKDSVGGGGVLDSAIYKATIKLAYITVAESGAMALNVLFKTDTGRDLKQQFWMTGGKAKGGKNTYTDKDGKEQYLPGFLMANSLAQLTTGKEIAQLDHETKVINLYSFDVKAEVPTKVEMITDMLNQEIYVGVIKQTVDKTAKNGDGVYVPTGDIREENEADKFFCAKEAYDKLTSSEIRAKVTEPAFYNTWKAKWEGQVRNKAKGAAAGTAPAAGGAKPAAAAGNGGTGKPTTSLFG